VIVWPTLLNYHGLYSKDRFNKRFINLAIIFRSSAEVLFFLISIIYIFQVAIVSRLLLLAFVLVNCFALIVKDSLLLAYLRRRRSKGLDESRVLLVGHIDAAIKFSSMFQEKDYLGFQPIGIVSLVKTEGAVSSEELPVLGSIDQFAEIIHNHHVDQVFFATKQYQHHQIMDAFLLCVNEGIEVWIMIDMYGMRLAQAKIDTFEGIPILTFRNAPVTTGQLIIKSFIDRLLALFLLTISFPFFLMLIGGVLFSSGSPIFFGQERVGHHGKRFTLYKFRSLGQGKDKWFSRWLRKSGLDEFPQLFNILKGEMSFVGPRPHIPQEISLYKNHCLRRRLSVKPGLTGLRQISRAEKIVFDEQLELDLRYIDQWSLFTDLSILAKTLPSVIKRFVGRYSTRIH